MSEISTQDAEETISCQFCKKPTPAEFNFCVECDNQIKCLNCDRKTYPGKSYCLACAQPLVERPAVNQAPNQYERNVKQDGDKYEEHTRFALSDNAVHEIAPFIINQTMPGAKGRAIGPQRPVISNGQAEGEETIDTTYEDETPEKPKQAESKQQQDGEQGGVGGGSTSGASATGNSSLSKFFERDGDALVAIQNDFKGQHWAEQQRNFILLYTKAHRELLGKPVPNTEAYRVLALKLKLADPNNFTTYVNKQASAYMTQMSTGLVLNAAGDKEVARVIKLMEDDSKSGHPYWARSASPTKQPSYLSKEDKDKVTGWVSQSGEIDFGKLDIRDISIARDYALLSLWLIIHKLKKAGAVKWNEALLFLTSKYDATSVSGGSFSKSMNTKEGEKYFAKNGEGLYYLTSAGQQLVEDWIAGKKSVKRDIPNS